MADRPQPPATKSSNLAGFLQQVAKIPAKATSGVHPGRLLFALDATASREPGWQLAMRTQQAMFDKVAELGGLEIQLAYYRGFAEFQHSAWHNTSQALTSRMAEVYCVQGLTQIHRIFKHTLDESRNSKIHALVFIGDSIEEDVPLLQRLAGQLGIKGIPAFLFQEGFDPNTEAVFTQLAKLSGGASCHFNADSPEQLKALLEAVAVYAAGGHKAVQQLARQSTHEVRRLIQQLR